MKLTICCHNFVFSEGLKKLLEEEPFVREVTVAESRHLKEVADRPNDLFIVDLDVIFGHAEDFFQKQRAKVLLIYNTSHLPLPSRQLSELILKGLVGILPPETDASLLRRAVRAVSSGELWLNQKFLKHLLVDDQQKGGLTRQEGQIAHYICRGYRNEEIARKLNITEQTVKSHCNRIYKKFGVSDRLQLALVLMSDRSLSVFEEVEGR